MVVSRCRCIGPPSSGIFLGTLFLLAADLRRHPQLLHPSARREQDWLSLRHPSRRLAKCQRGACAMLFVYKTRFDDGGGQHKE